MALPTSFVGAGLHGLTIAPTFPVDPPCNPYGCFFVERRSAWKPSTSFLPVAL